MGHTFYGYWTCKYCESEHRGDIVTCTNCGHTRDSDTKFYPNPKQKSEKRQYIQSYNDIGPDWACAHCGSMMSAGKSACTNCGHHREQTDKDYFELHPERKTALSKEGNCDE